ncbi:MAG: cupin domain-containing protein, partial [Clostridia bacterium]|nr:cupin domain-containing protein [Clostridia bacterium]
APETSHGEPMTHPGEEFVYVLEGEVIVSLEDMEYHVKAGETMHYPSTFTHHWRNPLKTETRLISMTSNTIF